MIDLTSSYETRVVGEDDTVWYTSSASWAKNDASEVRAVLGTDTVARPQSVRVMYQLKDAQGNTRANKLANPSLAYAGGTLTCGGPNANSGIGECVGTLSAASFATAGSVSLSLRWPNAGTVALADFASVSVQAEPQWSQDGGWNTPTSIVTQDVAFGVVLPYEDLFVPAGSSAATVTAVVYLKTHMAEDSAAERQVAVGKLKLVYPSAACTVTGDSGRNGAFATWEEVSGLGAGAYGLLFRNGQVEGYAVNMVSISLSCAAGTHEIGVETMSHADSNGLSSDPESEYATSVGRGGGYVTRASVLVKATTEDVGVFAYPADGRANLNNLASIGVSAPSLTVRLDSISNSPYVTRSTNVACAAVAPTTSCAYTPATSFAGAVALSVGHGAASDTLEIGVVAPLAVSLSADDTTLSAIACSDGTSTGTYQSTRLRLIVDDLEMTHLSTFRSMSPLVADVVGGSRVVGLGAGSALVRPLGGTTATVTITVEETAMVAELVARIPTAVSAAERVQVFNSEDDIGWMYVYATYANGDAHAVDSSALDVDVVAADKLSFTLDGARQQVSIVQDALAGSSCVEPLLQVSLFACNVSSDDALGRLSTSSCRRRWSFAR